MCSDVDVGSSRQLTEGRLSRVSGAVLPGDADAHYAACSVCSGKVKQDLSCAVKEPTAA